MRTEKAALRFARMLGLESPVEPAALYGAAADHDYLRNLLVCRGNPKFLQVLLSAPPQGEAPEGELMDRLVGQWAKRAEETRLRQEYEEKYGAYLRYEAAQDEAGQKPCGAGVQSFVKGFRQVNLDNHATTELRPEIRWLLSAYDRGEYGFGNPSSATMPGYLAGDHLLEARRRIARLLGVPAGCIYFTGSGSEANNLAIKGIALNRLKQKGHIVTTRAEHKSVLEAVDWLEEIGFSVTRLTVDQEGRVDPGDAEEALRPDTLLVAVMTANNEVGTVNPMKEISQICKKAGVPLFSDAVQAFGRIPLEPLQMGISAMSFSAHKLGGPKGIGGLYVEEGLSLVPLIHGGGQEKGLRGGTENVAGAMAFAYASQLAWEDMEKQAERWDQLRRGFLAELAKIDPDFRLLGHPRERLPQNICLAFPGVSGRALQKSLSKAGIAVSTGSACGARRMPQSHVLRAMGISPSRYGVIRLGMGIDTNEEDLDYALRQLEGILPQLKGRAGDFEDGGAGVFLNGETGFLKNPLND